MSRLSDRHREPQIDLKPISVRARFNNGFNMEISGTVLDKILTLEDNAGAPKLISRYYTHQENLFSIKAEASKEEGLRNYLKVALRPPGEIRAEDAIAIVEIGTPQMRIYESTYFQPDGAYHHLRLFGDGIVCRDADALQRKVDELLLRSDSPAVGPYRSTILKIATAEITRLMKV